MKINLLNALLFLSTTPGVLCAADGPGSNPAPDSSAQRATAFADASETALTAMKKKAEALHIQGVAVIAYAEGDTVRAWTSKMLVVGKMTVPASAPNKW